jgi:hypothetical protein
MSIFACQGEEGVSIHTKNSGYFLELSKSLHTHQDCLLNQNGDVMCEGRVPFLGCAVRQTASAPGKLEQNMEAPPLIFCVIPSAKFLNRIRLGIPKIMILPVNTYVALNPGARNESECFIYTSPAQPSKYIIILFL